MRDCCFKLWILVDNKIPTQKFFQILIKSDQEISRSIKNVLSKFMITFVYAIVLLSSRHMLWNKHCSIALALTWLILGNFNVVLDAHECLGGHAPNPSSCVDVVNMIVENNFQEIMTKKARFTGPLRSPIDDMECKLDRALCNSNWMDFGAITSYFTLLWHSSDHNLSVVSFILDKPQGPTPFRFKYMWLEHENFKVFIKNFIKKK